MYFDSVVSIGGHALTAAVWRLVQGASGDLHRPLPLMAPGLTNGSLEIVGITPSVTADGASVVLTLRVDFVVRGETWLPARTPTGTPPLPAVAPIVIPVELLASGGAPLQLNMSIPLAHTSPLGARTNNALRIQLGRATSAWRSAIDQAALEDALRAGAASVGNLLGVVADSDRIAATARDLLAAVEGAAQRRLEHLLTGVQPSTGRLLTPTPTSVPCDLNFAPHAAEARLAVNRGQAMLQVGFAMRPDTRLGGGASWPNFRPSSLADVQVDIDNTLAVELLCCVLEKAPNMTFDTDSGPSGPFVLPLRSGGSLVVEGCTWSRVVVQLGPVALVGTLSVGIGPGSGSKTIGISGRFRSGSALLDIDATISVAIEFGLSPGAALTGVRFAEPPLVSANVALSAATIGAVTAISVAPLIQPAGAAVGALVPLAVSFINAQLDALCRTLLSHVQMLSSAPAVPPGLFEAFGSFVPASITIDDVAATGTLTTPPSIPPTWTPARFRLPSTTPTDLRSVDFSQLHQEPPP